MIDKKKLLQCLVILEILAILISSYLIYLHYKEGKSFCDISERFNCDIVNKSLYSELFGIPVALFGLITFLIMLGLTYNLFNKKSMNLFGFQLDYHNTIYLLFAILIFSVLFSAYLVYIELFVLLSICLFCVVLDILIILMLIIIILLLKNGKKK